MNGTGITSYRTVFLSDIHLGTRWCRAKELCAFLSAIRCERLYLVGDIIDGCKLGRRPGWLRAHNEVIRGLLKMSQRMEIVYIPGNHDTFMDAFDGKRFGRISVRKEAVHENADGRSFLVVHGDEFDAVVRCRKRLARRNDNLPIELAQRLEAPLFGRPHTGTEKEVQRKISEIQPVPSK